MSSEVLPRMKELVKFTWESVKPKINPYNRKHTFEIFGYDFMLDEKGGLFLIEVNTNPCLEESSPLLESLIPRMINDGFKLTLDRLFPPGKNYPSAQLSSFPVESYLNEENMW